MAASPNRRTPRTSPALNCLARGDTRIRSRPDGPAQLCFGLRSDHAGAGRCPPGAAPFSLSAERKACRTFRCCSVGRRRKIKPRLAQTLLVSGCRRSVRPGDFTQPRIGLRLVSPIPSAADMGETAEVLAVRHHPRGTGCFRLALAPARSRRARKTREGDLRGLSGIQPVKSRGPKLPGHHPDNGPRENQSGEALAKLKPVFDSRNADELGNSRKSPKRRGGVAGDDRSNARRNLVSRRSVFLCNCNTRAATHGTHGARPIVRHRQGGNANRTENSGRWLIELNEAFAARKVLAVLKGATSEQFARDHLKREAAG